MKKFYTYVTRPYVISILPAIIIFILVPLDINRYTLKVDSYFRNKNQSYAWYDDLDMDGSSESILAPETDKNLSINHHPTNPRGHEPYKPAVYFLKVIKAERGKSISNCKELIKRM